MLRTNQILATRFGIFCLIVGSMYFLLSCIGNLNGVDRLLPNLTLNLTKELSGFTILSFSDFLKTGNQNSSTSTLGLIIPDKLLDGFRGKINIQNLNLLATIFKKFGFLRTISGASLLLDENEKPMCSMDRNGWTVDLRQDYSKFVDGSKSISIDSDDGRPIACYPCDLLPDVFLIDLSKTSELIDDSFGAMRESARIPFFLRSKGRSAYCPDMDIVDKPDRKWKKLTCNNLSTIWDGNFLLLPQLVGIYRLITHRSLDQWIDRLVVNRSPDQVIDSSLGLTNRSISDRTTTSTEYWLLCTWAKSSHDSGLPIHCSNWLRQYLFDLVDIIEDGFGYDYRLVYGTALGALRSKDVIPWTPDIDIVLIKESGTRVRNRWRKDLRELSGWRYSHEDRTGNGHYAPLRAFPICPISLTIDQILNQTITDSIDRSLKQANQSGASFSYDSWRSAGYVDIYESHFHFGFKCDDRKLAAKFERVEIAGRRFKTVIDPVHHVKCLYGANWENPPKNVAKDWNSFIESN